jgi:hypothetical protein
MPTFTRMLAGNVCYGSINSSKSPSSGAGSNFDSEVGNLESEQSLVQINVCFCIQGGGSASVLLLT